MGIFDKLFILELANNHMGDVEHGCAVIREFGKVCKKFPFRFAFKFQYRHLDTFIHPEYKGRKDIKYVARFEETRLAGAQFLRLKAEAAASGFIGVCTPFDEPSVDLVVEHGYDIIKVASCSFTDWPLLEKIAGTDRPVILSTAGAELRVLPGFSAAVYVTGQGFDVASTRAARGLPSTSTLAVDHAGALLLARTGRRYLGDEVDLLRLYRIAAGGARLAPGDEARYAWGPPLWNPQVSAGRAGREIFVTTFERDRRIGAVYRLLDGRAELFAGGTPPRGAAPLLVQPEGVAVDRSGRVYVADRERGVVVRFEPGSDGIIVKEPLPLTGIEVGDFRLIDEYPSLWIRGVSNFGTGSTWLRHSGVVTGKLPAVREDGRPVT